MVKTFLYFDDRNHIWNIHNIDWVFLGLTPPYLSGRELEGWLTESWAQRGASRARFFQNCLLRFCPDLMTELLEMAKDDLITKKFDFWSDPGLMNSIYKALANLFAFDWVTVGFLACQDDLFLRRLTPQSLHEFNRAKTFLQNFTAFCEFRNLRVGPASERFDVSTF